MYSVIVKEKMEKLLKEGPTLLQLHKWEPSQLQLNLSEFRETFISPSRQSLLLLSHHSEALLLPLTAGNSYSLLSYSYAFHFCSVFQLFSDDVTREFNWQRGSCRLS